MTLKRALHWSLFDNTSSIGLSFISSLFIARLLTPDDIGVFSITASIIAIAQFIRDFGMSSYLIKEEHLTKDKVYSCFTLSLLLSATVGILFILFSSQLGRFYDRPEIADAVTLLALNFFLIPFGTMSLALLKRQMRFKAIAAINFTSTIAHILVSLSCAFAGFGFYSLIYASLVGTLVTVLGSNAIQRQFSTLGISFRYTKVIAQFGGYVSLSGVANQIAVALREVIIGKNISIESAAFFGKAVAITEILNKLVSGAIQKVIGPHIASLKRGGQDFLLFYKISTTLYASLVIPIYAFLALNANNLILLLFGDQWGAATALVPYVCLGLSLYSFSFAFEQTMLALGEAKYLSFFTVVLAILRVAVFLYASRFGLEVFAASLVIINLVRFSLISYFMRKSFGSHNFIDLADLIKILLTVLLVVASCLVVRSFAFQSAILELAVGGLFAVCVFIFAQLILKQKLYAEIRKTF